VLLKKLGYSLPKNNFQCYDCTRNCDEGFKTDWGGECGLGWEAGGRDWGRLPLSKQQFPPQFDFYWQRIPRLNTYGSTPALRKQHRWKV